MSTFVITGSTGFIGSSIIPLLRAEGHTVRTIGRHAQDNARWGDPDSSLARVLEGTDVLLHLAGRTVNCRYNAHTVDELFSSRVETTAALGRAMRLCDTPPAVWLNASSGTYYADTRNHPNTEAAGTMGSGLSVAIVRAWEQELFTAEVPARKVALRTSFVLGNQGGALPMMARLAKFGLGGHQGDGGQLVSWIHINDMIAAIWHVIATEDISGPVNIATPQPVTNAELMAGVRKYFGGSVGSRFGIPTPRVLLEVGARIIRTETELVLKSRWVSPEVLEQTGFAWSFDTVDACLADLASHS